METEKNSQRDDNLERAPDWPQRPVRPPTPGPTRAPYGYRASEAPDRSDVTKDTQIIPAVEPSRFDNGATHAQPRPTPEPQAKAEPSSVQPKVTSNNGNAAYKANTVEAYKPRRATQRAYVQPAKPGDHVRYLSTDPAGTKRKKSFGWVLWVIAGVFAIGIVAAMAITLAWQGQYTNRVYAGVSVLGVDLGGKTTDEAREAVEDRLKGFVAQPITLTWQGKEWKPNAEQLGVKIDVDESIDEAYGVGRGGDYFGNAGQQWYASQSGYRVPLVVQISEPAMQEYLNSIAQTEVNQELSEGDVRLNGAEVIAIPGKEGRTVRVYEAIAAIREQVAKLEQGPVELPIDVVKPNIAAEEVEPIKGLLATRVSAPITATVPGGKTMTLDRDALVRFTTIKRNPDPNSQQHIMLGWDEDELGILADRWTEEARHPAKNARFAWSGGALSVLSESAEGFQTDAKTVIAAVKEHADTADKREFQLPGKVVAPVVSSKDIGTLGIKGLMGKGTSTFSGSSAERATNIKVAAKLLDGAVVPPGGTFSFLDTMGGIDEDHGFVEGYVIAAERTQRGVGGGVCQVSTTAFRAAFWSGVDITERNQHSYRVGWYESNGEPVGFDAAVFDPGVDMKFVNDTPGYILVQATVSGSTLTVSFYGTKQDGEVSLDGPAISNRLPPPPDVYQVDTRLPPGTKKQVETAHGGLDTVITRRISVSGQADKVEKFRSSYKAWANWYIVASPEQVPGYQPPTETPAPAANPTPAAEATLGTQGTSEQPAASEPQNTPEAAQPTAEVAAPTPEAAPTSNP